ncbi:hypothetical protein MTO96_024123 [Rhipicephalus appendiculatus]
MDEIDKHTLVGSRPVSRGAANDVKRSPPPLGELSEFPPLGESEGTRRSVPMYDEEGIIELVREIYGFVRLKRYPSESACFLKDDEARDWYSDGSDKPRGLTGCDGVVDRVKSEYGFIRLGPHSAPAAFFRVSVLEQSIEKSVKDVSEVLAVGDLVRFDAELNLKENTSAKWWITYIRPASPPPGAHPREDVGKPPGREGPRGSNRGPRDVGVCDSDYDDNDDDNDDDDDVYQNSSLPAKCSEKKALPWSYARCAARAVADEGVPTANTSAPKMRPPPATTTSTVSKMTSFLARPSLLVYRSVRGIAKRVGGGDVVECEVRETGGPRRVRLGDDCPFYRNGVRLQGNGGVRELGEGDQLTLDYVVATDVTSVKDADVHCYLAWQGERPCNVPHLSVALLSRALKGEAKRRAVVGSSESSSESSDEDDSDVIGGSREAETRT